MKELNNFTIEEQFSIAAFDSQADKLSKEQAIELAKDIHRSYIVQQKTFRALLKTKWME